MHYIICLQGLTKQNHMPQLIAILALLLCLGFEDNSSYLVALTDQKPCVQRMSIYTQQRVSEVRVNLKNLQQLKTRRIIVAKPLSTQLEKEVIGFPTRFT